MASTTGVPAARLTGVSAPMRLTGMAGLAVVNGDEGGGWSVSGGTQGRGGRVCLT